MLILWTLLFLAACVGHAAILIYFINYLYGTRFRGWWVSGIRLLLQLLIILGPLVALYLSNGDPKLFGNALGAFPPLAIYIVMCFCVSLIEVPFQTIRRWFRRVPPVQLSNHTLTLDVAKELGHKPLGQGKQWYLGHLPGNEIFQVDFTEKTLRLPQLPAAWDGLTILHVTDLHLRGTPDREFYELVMDRCAAEPPDLLALTGDTIDSPKHYHWLRPVLQRLRWRLFAFGILGNHDTWFDTTQIRNELNDLGIDMIGGLWKQISIKGEPMIVLGNEMPWVAPHPDLTGCPSDIFRLCLSHTPDNLPWARAQGIDLVLAGHNHGGQIRVPGFGPIHVPSKFSRRYDAGTFHEPPTVMHVCRGLGATHPIRYNCRPEITRLTLRR